MATDWLASTEYRVTLSDKLITDMVTMASTRERMWFVENRWESIGPFYKEREAQEFCERANQIQPNGKRLGNHVQIEYVRQP